MRWRGTSKWLYLKNLRCATAAIKINGVLIVPYLFWNNSSKNETSDFFQGWSQRKLLLLFHIIKWPSDCVNSSVSNSDGPFWYGLPTTVYTYMYYVSENYICANCFFFQLFHCSTWRVAVWLSLHEETHARMEEWIRLLFYTQCPAVPGGNIIPPFWKVKWYAHQQHDADAVFCTVHTAHTQPGERIRNWLFPVDSGISFRIQSTEHIPHSS